VLSINLYSRAVMKSLILSKKPHNLLFSVFVHREVE